MSLLQLIIGRLVTGLGGAGMTTMVTIIITGMRNQTNCVLSCSEVNFSSNGGRHGTFVSGRNPTKLY